MISVAAGWIIAIFDCVLEKLVEFFNGNNAAYFRDGLFSFLCKRNVFFEIVKKRCLFTELLNNQVISFF